MGHLPGQDAKIFGAEMSAFDVVDEKFELQTAQNGSLPRDR